MIQPLSIGRLTVICWLSSIQMIFAQSDITFKTLAITNEDYITTSNWEKVNLDPDGDDLNCKRYGSIYYPPYIKNSDIHEGGKTIAKDYMEIEVDLINDSDKNWVLDNTHLKIVRKYDYSAMDIVANQWEIRMDRSSGDNPYFEIEPDVSLLEDDEPDFVLWTKDEYQDSHVIVEVACLEGSVNTIYAFKLVFIFSNADDENEILELDSDKTYLLASN